MTTHTYDTHLVWGGSTRVGYRAYPGAGWRAQPGVGGLVARDWQDDGMVQRQLGSGSAGGPRSQDVRIETVVPEDAGELLTLQRAAYATEARLYGDPELPALTQTLLELQEELASVTALKAVAGYRIVGAVRAHVDTTALHVGRLTVAPDWQGHGIGSQLLAAVEAPHHGVVDTAALFTGHLSTANLAMYRRRGYLEQRREDLRPRGGAGAPEQGPGRVTAPRGDQLGPGRACLRRHPTE